MHTVSSISYGENEEDSIFFFLIKVKLQPFSNCLEPVSSCD